MTELKRKKTGSGTVLFSLCMAIFLVAALTMSITEGGDYLLFAGYVVLQFIVLATGWNILGGYAGYVNFGAAGFFAIGAYSSVALFKFMGFPLPVLILASALVGALLGIVAGGITLRLRGVYFSIATLAFAIVLETVVMNWGYVGGARGTSVLPPDPPALFADYQRWLFFVMALLVVIAVSIARYIQHSWIGRGLRAIRDEEIAAESSGVPTLRLKLVATAISGAIMSAAAAPFAMYLSFIEPASAFSLNYALSAIAMPIIGGTAHWLGPVVGAALLGSTQQALLVYFSGSVNVLVTGLLLIFFVIAAPQGIVGLASSLYGRLKQRGRP